MNHPLLIGLLGRKRSGKDSFCQYLAAQGSFPIQRMAFADALKIEVAQHRGLTVEQLEADKTRLRPFLQWWGTEFRRAEDPDYWVRHMPEPSRLHLNVVTDVRFQNEADWVTERGGLLVRIVRPQLLDDDTHASELLADEIQAPLTIYNSSSSQKFFKTASTFLRRYLDGEFFDSAPPL